jgi:predicted transcriptional regulator of viral defense system
MSMESKIRKEKIISFIREKGTATFSEICEYINATSVSFTNGEPATVNKSIIAGHLQHLINKGIVERASRGAYRISARIRAVEEQDNIIAPTSVETPKTEDEPKKDTPEPSVSEQAQNDAYN